MQAIVPENVNGNKFVNKIKELFKNSMNRLVNFGQRRTIQFNCALLCVLVLLMIIIFWRMTHSFNYPDECGKECQGCDLNDKTTNCTKCVVCLWFFRWWG